jgi:Fe-Mn family superoxide dismutase
MTSLFMKFFVVTLPYLPNALEPVISQQTVELHYGVHYQGYVDKLNVLVSGTELEGESLEEIVRKAPYGPLFSNAGQVLNHQLYFTQFQSVEAPKTYPSVEMMQMIDRSFGSLENLKHEVNKAASTLFGSGWVWVEADVEGNLYVCQYKNADNPVRYGRIPLIAFDVWEHAYYLDWMNKRTAHVDALWELINWDVIAERYG